MTKQDWIFIFVVIFLSGVIGFLNFLPSAGFLSDAGIIAKSLFSLGFIGSESGLYFFEVFGMLSRVSQNIFLEPALKTQTLPILLGLTSIPMFYYFLKRNTSEVGAKLGIIVFSLSLWHMILSRFVPEISFAFLLSLSAIWLCWWTIKKNTAESVIVFVLIIGLVLNFAFVLWPIAFALIMTFVMFNAFHQNFDINKSLASTRLHASKLLGFFVIGLLFVSLPLVYKLSVTGYLFVDNILAGSIFAFDNPAHILLANLRQIITNLGLSSINLLLQNNANTGILSPFAGILFIVGLAHSLFRSYKHKQKDGYIPVGQAFLLFVMVSATLFGLFLEPQMAGMAFVTLALIPVFSYIAIALGWVYILLSKNQEVKIYSNYFQSNNFFAKFAVGILIIALTAYDISRFLHLIYVN